MTNRLTDKQTDGLTDRQKHYLYAIFVFSIDNPSTRSGCRFFVISPCQLQVFIPYTLLPRLRIFYVLNSISQLVLLFSLSLICEHRMFPCFGWRLFRCSRSDYDWCFCGAHFDARNQNIGLMWLNTIILQYFQG